MQRKLSLICFVLFIGSVFLNAVQVGIRRVESSAYLQQIREAVFAGYYVGKIFETDGRFPDEGQLSRIPTRLSRIEGVGTEEMVRYRVGFLGMNELIIRIDESGRPIVNTH